MFSHVLITSDLSAASDAVMYCLPALKRLGATECTLFHALGVRHIDSLGTLLRDAVQPVLLRQKEILDQSGLTIHLEIAKGIPSEELNDYASRNAISLIVMGTHGESAAEHSLFRLGKVTSEVLHHHSKPLLLLRTRIIDRHKEFCLPASCEDFAQHVLFATDFSETAALAFSHVKALVGTGCRHITLLHVQDRTKIYPHLMERLEEFNRIDTERLEMHRNLLLQLGAESVEIKLPFGNPTQEILNESKLDYSLVVLGSQGKGFIHEVFIGSVSHNVARHAEMAVLLVPALR